MSLCGPACVSEPVAPALQRFHSQFHTLPLRLPSTIQGLIKRYVTDRDRLVTHLGGAFTLYHSRARKNDM